MRERAKKGGISVHGIAGSYVVLVGMDVTEQMRKGLLGFSIERIDRTEDERYWLKGFKTFEQSASQNPGTLVSTLNNPIQDFQWGDYTAKPGHTYVYRVVPAYGTPENLTHGPEVELTISTEAEDEGSHAVFFNRGVAGSQAYVRKFGNVPPYEVEDNKAFEWLSRGLLEGMVRFIRQANGSSWSIRASVYEFTYIPILEEFRAAIDRGVDVRIIYDNKANGPGEANRNALRKAKIDSKFAIPRNANPSYISHNKFILLLKNDKPVEVWTGSTNITDGGIFGHSNVGHIIRDEGVAAAYMDYWNMLSQDPQAKKLRTWCDSNNPVPGGRLANQFIQPIFSCRGSLTALEWYAEKMDSAKSSVFFTAAFGINKLFEDVLKEDKPYLRFILLDKPGKGLDIIRGDRDNQISVGGVLDENALDKWLNSRWKEEKLTGLNKHVQYIHTKYMLLDPLGDDPIVITGSANFSKNSTINNDENMVVIRGNGRVADMYLGEFMRLYDHFRFRGTQLGDKAKSRKGKKPSLYLTPDDSWTNAHFQAGHPKQKQRLLFS
ncbi:MAG TPA: phospholipase D-like domain-containing protein [Dehalococcoidales bacterium]